MKSSERKRVLFLAPSMMGGGAERVFSILLRHLDRLCIEPHLGLLQSQGPYMADLPEDIVIHDLRISRVRYALPAIVRLIWQVRPHSVISTLRHLNTLVILGKPFLPKTKLLVRESAFISTTLENETNHPKMWAWLYRHLYKHTDRVICISNAMADDLVNNLGVPREKVVRIYNPVDSRRVRELAEQGGSPYLGPGPHLVAAGRFTREKGFDILLSALPSVIRRFPTADVVILGDGALKEELLSQAQQEGLMQYVRFPGFDSNPWRYFRHADLFVLPSRYEGLPNTLVEALAVGTRVVATDCPGGIREIQACDQEMTLTRSEDPNALATTIISAYETSRNRNGGRQRSSPDLSRFDVGQIVAEYSRLF